MSKKPRPPQFNHVAMSLPADALDADGRAAIGDFYGEVFGFEELPTMTVDRERLVLKAYTYEQFVFLIADDQPMRAPRMDHFGLSVGTLHEFDEFYARAKAFRARDDRVDLVERDIDDYGGLKIHNFYVGFLLPMMVELQHWEFIPHQPITQSSPTEPVAPPASDTPTTPATPTTPTTPT